MEASFVTCSICGEDRAGQHRLARGLIVFCCEACVPLIEDLHTSYRDEPAATA